MIWLIKKIIWYFEGKKIWDAKMSEELVVRVVSTPKDEQK